MQAMAGTMWALGAANRKLAANGLLNNLVAYWGLDEAGGANNALDKHTNALTLTQANSPGSDTGLVYAGARTFDGSSRYFGRVSEALLQGGAVSFAFAAWVYKSASGTRMILSKDDAYINREYMLLVTDTTVAFATFPGGTYSPASVAYAMPLNEWHLVCGWRDQTVGKIYCSVDNGTPAEATVSAAPAGTTVFMIGNVNYANTIKWAGRIGPVALWKNRTLDATARTALFNAGAGLAYDAFTT